MEASHTQFWLSVAVKKEFLLTHHSNGCGTDILPAICDIPAYTTLLTVKLALVDIIIKVADGTEVVKTKLEATLTAVVGHLASMEGESKLN